MTIFEEEMVKYQNILDKIVNSIDAFVFESSEEKKIIIKTFRIQNR